MFIIVSITMGAKSLKFKKRGGLGMNSTTLVS